MPQSRITASLLGLSDSVHIISSVSLEELPGFASRLARSPVSTNRLQPAPCCRQTRYLSLPTKEYPELLERVPELCISVTAVLVVVCRIG